MSTLHRIYCFNNGGSPGWLHAIALADDGTCLAQHVCSHQAYMRHDLGMDESTWKHDNYNKHFGEGNWELEWVDAPKSHEGVTEAYRLNQQNGEVPAVPRHEFVEAPHEPGRCRYCDEPAKDAHHLTQRDLDNQTISSAWEDLQD